jgi:hypothetical protein
VTSAPMRDLRRRGSRGENNAVRILLLKDGGSPLIPGVGADHARPAERRRSSLGQAVTQVGEYRSEPGCGPRGAVPPVGLWAFLTNVDHFSRRVATLGNVYGFVTPDG